MDNTELGIRRLQYTSRKLNPFPTNAFSRCSIFILSKTHCFLCFHASVFIGLELSNISAQSSPSTDGTANTDLVNSEAMPTSEHCDLFLDSPYSSSSLSVDRQKKTAEIRALLDDKLRKHKRENRRESLSYAMTTAILSSYTDSLLISQKFILNKTCIDNNSKFCKVYIQWS